MALASVISCASRNAQSLEHRSGRWSLASPATLLPVGCSVKVPKGDVVVAQRARVACRRDIRLKIGQARLDVDWQRHILTSVQS